MLDFRTSSFNSWKSDSIRKIGGAQRRIRGHKVHLIPQGKKYFTFRVVDMFLYPKYSRPFPYLLFGKGC